MFTIRFPNGTAIQYNTARYAISHQEYTDIYERKDGAWIAQIPNDCIIEVLPACRVYNPLSNDTTTKEELNKKLAECILENNRLGKSISALRGYITRLKKGKK